MENEKALSPTVLKLGVVSLFADIASEMLYPITPIFLTTVLGASMGSLGLIEGVAEAIASLLKTYSGAWSDSMSRRKPFVVVGYLLAAVSKPFVGLSQNWIHVLGARALDRTGKGIRSAPRDALIADAVLPSQRGAAFGIHRAMDTIGAAIGPLLAIGLLSFKAEDLRSLYYWAIIPGLLSVLVVLTIKEPVSHPQARKFENPFRSWKDCGPDFKRYVFAWGLFSLANSSDVFLLLRAKNSGFTTQSVILLYCVYNLIYALSSPYLGKISDRTNKVYVLMGGLFVFAAVYLGFGFSTEHWHFWILFAIYGLYMGATDGVGKALAVDLVPKNLKATAIGILGTVTGLCTIVASVVAGKLWDNSGPKLTFTISAAVAVLATISLAALIKKTILKGDSNASLA